MRRFAGWILFFGAIGGLGYWAHEIHAPGIEDHVQSELELADLNAFPNASFTISGRDITVHGTVKSKAERDALLERLANLKRHRAVHDQLDVSG